MLLRVVARCVAPQFAELPDVELLDPLLSVCVADQAEQPDHGRSAGDDDHARDGIVVSEPIGHDDEDQQVAERFSHDDDEADEIAVVARRFGATPDELAEHPGRGAGDDGDEGGDEHEVEHFAALQTKELWKRRHREWWRCWIDSQTLTTLYSYLKVYST